MAKCTYELAWRQGCDKDAVIGNRCEEHQDIKCCSCGAPATHECEQTFQFVCGFPLCDNCEDDGNGRHVKKEVNNV